MAAQGAPGLRVVRGPDWEWGDQDGGEGFVGTVVGLEEGGSVIVQWDMGQKCRYRCGRDNKFDLRVFDSGPSGKLTKFTSLYCEWCQEEGGLEGLVWRCTRCLDYYLCNQCYHNDRHSIRHPFFRLDSADIKTRIRHPCRGESRKVTVKGVFPESRVVRGTDWQWKDQDGGVGTKGKVVAIKDWKDISLRGVAEVLWGEELKCNIYRLGLRGKVDLKCVEPAEGGSYYIDHLPALGATYAADNSTSSEQQLSAGDVVKVELDTDILKLMQAEHGGWNDTMASLIGLPAVVNYIHSDGDPELRYNTNHIFKFNADAVSKEEGMEVYFTADVVRVIDDTSKLHELQKAGPGWVNELAMTIGHVGMVIKRTVLGHLQVRVSGQRWVYDPQCLTKVPPDLLPNNHDQEDVDMNARSQLYTLFHAMDPLDVLVQATAAGDTDTVRQYLYQHPDQVNRMVDGRGAMHEACKEGYWAVLEIILEYNPDLELTDCNGLRPVHSCAYSNCGKAMSLLLKAGADINSKGPGESTALMVAAALGHIEVVSAILAHHLLNIHAGGCLGDTALQCAVVARRSDIVRLLLEAGAEPSIADFTASSPLHRAVGMGHYQIVEKILMYYPEYVNLQKEDDGFALVHVAAANNQTEILELLLQQSACNINLKTLTDLTALHVAAHEGHATGVELLVGYGADLNVAVDNGNTALHLILAKNNMKPLDCNTPYTLQVEKKLTATFGERNFTSYTVVACMLILEGAELYQKNTIGVSPMALCPPATADVLRHVIEKCGRGKYHGSLRKSAIQLPNFKKKKAATSSDASGSEVSKAFPPKDLERGPEHSQGTSELPDDYENKPSRNERALKSAPDAADSASSKEEQSQDSLCCLCDQDINVKLSPCGHAVMCFGCSHIAKRCPNCNVPITGRDYIIT